MSKPVRKPASNNFTFRMPESAKQKLERIARKITPTGTRPNIAAAVRNLIEKEKA